MTRKILLPSFLGVAVFMLTGCPSNEVMESKNVSQSEIHQALSAVYDEEDNTGKVNAEFRVAGPNGTTLVLSEPSDIRVNGTELKLDTYLLGGVYYTLSQGKRNGDLNFEFIDYDKKSYKNSFKMLPATFAQTLTELSKSETTKLAYMGPDLLGSETLKLTISGDSVSTTIDANLAEKAFVITPDALKDFQPKENVTLSMERNQSGSLQQATARGGTFSITYRSKKIKASIK